MQRYSFLSAVHLFLIKKEEILLLKRFNTGYEDGNYSLIAGHLEGNETIKSAMIREAKEEAGITIKSADLKVVHTMHRKSLDQERIDFFLLGITWTGDISNLEPDKCAGLD